MKTFNSYFCVCLQNRICRDSRICPYHYKYYISVSILLINLIKTFRDNKNNRHYLGKILEQYIHLGLRNFTFLFYYTQISLIRLQTTTSKLIFNESIQLDNSVCVINDCLIGTTELITFYQLVLIITH